MRRCLEVTLDGIRRCLEVTLDGMRHCPELTLDGMRRCHEVTLDGMRRCLEVTLDGMRRCLEVTLDGIRRCLEVTLGGMRHYLEVTLEAHKGRYFRTSRETDRVGVLGQAPNTEREAFRASEGRPQWGKARPRKNEKSSGSPLRSLVAGVVLHSGTPPDWVGQVRYLTGENFEHALLDGREGTKARLIKRHFLRNVRAR